MLTDQFFSQEADQVAKSLLGKVIRVRHEGYFLSAIIIETEAYFLHDKASHASLGYTPSRKALFMEPGTIYMYHSRAGDSLNISCLGEGNAVLIKSAYPYIDDKSHPHMLSIMQSRHSPKQNRARAVTQLCNGQALLCRSLGLKRIDWDQKSFDEKDFFLEDVAYTPKTIIQTKRLGIPKGRDEHLPHRYIDLLYAKYCTKNPVRLFQTP